MQEDTSLILGHWLNLSMKLPTIKEIYCVFLDQREGILVSHLLFLLRKYLILRIDTMNESLPKYSILLPIFIHKDADFQGVLSWQREDYIANQ